MALAGEPVSANGVPSPPPTAAPHTPRGPPSPAWPGCPHVGQHVALVLFGSPKHWPLWPGPLGEHLEGSKVDSPFLALGIRLSRSEKHTALGARGVSGPLRESAQGFCLSLEGAV